MLVVNVNFHFLRPENGSGDYANITFQDVQNHVDELNYIYANIQSPTLAVTPPAEEIPDSRIRFHLQNIYFHDDDIHNSFTDNSISFLCSTWFLHNYGVETNKTINIFYFNVYDPNTSLKTGSAGCGPQSFVNMRNSDLIGAGLLAHELGHVLNLDHTFAGCGDDGLDDTYHPDPNMGWNNCGANQSYSECGGGTGISNNIMGYNHCRRYLSPKQLALMHHHKTANDQKRKYLTCDTHSFNTDVTILADATWESRKVIDGNLTVKAGKTLMVKCMVYMKPSSKIVVEPNARLIIDGGILTNYCDNMWQGIEVWGNSSEHQFPGTHPTHQGKVEIINGGIIENANLAINLMNPADWNSMGGVVYTDDAIFRNNNRSVAFMSYQNTHPTTGLPHSNLSNFNNTLFEVNDDFIGSNDFHSFVTLWDVDGVNFTNCHFENNQTNKTHNTALNKGIYSEDAGYNVLSSCNSWYVPCPPNDLQKSHFKGLNVGIHATSSAIGKTISVKEADFEGNLYGVQINDVDNFVVLSSDFEVGGYNASGFFGIHYGIMAEGTNGYRIEENNFDKSSTTSALANVGVAVSNTFAPNDEVYKNTFSELDFGAWSLGTNRNPNNAYEGLQVLCNDFNSTNFYDITVSEGIPPASTDGFRLVQGDNNTPSISAGNLLSHTGNNNASDINNLTGWPTWYYHNTTAEAPL